MLNLEEYWFDCLKLLLESKGNMLVGVHKFVTNNTDENRGEYSRLICNGVYDLVGYPLKSWILHEYVTQLEDENRIYLENIGDEWTFSERLCNYLPYDRDIGDEEFVCSVNQLDVICRELINDKYTGRAVATLYIPHIDEWNVNIPNLQYIQFVIKEDNLFLLCMFSEHDLYNEFIKDILFLKYMGLCVVEKLVDYYPNLRLHMIDYSCGKLYINKEDIEDIERCVELNE